MYIISGEVFSIDYLIKRAESKIVKINSNIDSSSYYPVHKQADEQQWEAEHDQVDAVAR